MGPAGGWSPSEHELARREVDPAVRVPHHLCQPVAARGREHHAVLLGPQPLQAQAAQALAQDPADWLEFGRLQARAQELMDALVAATS